MNQVERLSEKAGGDAKLARLSGNVSPSQVTRWKDGGFVPAHRHQLILENAKKEGIPITKDDFFGDDKAAREARIRKARNRTRRRAKKAQAS